MADFYYAIKGRFNGPVPWQEIEQLAAVGEINPQTPIHTGDKRSTFKAGEIAELKFGKPTKPLKVGGLSAGAVLLLIFGVVLTLVGAAAGAQINVAVAVVGASTGVILIALSLVLESVAKSASSAEAIARMMHEWIEKNRP